MIRARCGQSQTAPTPEELIQGRTIAVCESCMDQIVLEWLAVHVQTEPMVRPS